MAAVDVSVLGRSFALVRARALVRDAAFLPLPALDTASEYVEDLLGGGVRNGLGKVVELLLRDSDEVTR
jgi:hypothetical protein